MNDAGNTVERHAYDAWGRERNVNDWSDYTVESGKLDRGYTGHESLREFGLINMNGRMYDPILGRMLSPDNYVQNPFDIQNYNRYTYCRNNPLSYTDPSGNLFLWTVINAIKDFFVNTFVNVWTQGVNAWTDSDNWKSTTNAFKIDIGLFNGDIGQILSRLTWEAPQTFFGYTVAGVQNTFYGVKDVSSYGGATVTESYSRKWGAFTLGSYIYGNRGIHADPGNSLFQHEYGHYLQSQSSGPFYLQKYAIPSLIDAARKDVNHKEHAVEQDANIRAYLYFKQNVKDFDCTDEYGRYVGYKWNFNDHPIAGYDRTLSLSDPHNISALKKGIVELEWYDYFIGSPMLAGLINNFILRQ